MKMVLYLICFDMSAPAQVQNRQLTYWLEFLNSAIETRTTFNDSKQAPWRIMLVGLKSDDPKSSWQPGDEKLTNECTGFPQSWPGLPLYERIIAVSSYAASSSVETLIRYITEECDRILQLHARCIPTSYKEVLHRIKKYKIADGHAPIATVKDLIPPCAIGLAQSDFCQCLRYLHSIGSIVYLAHSELVCTDPARVPKIAAKVSSPPSCCVGCKSYPYSHFLVHISVGPPQ